MTTLNDFPPSTSGSTSRVAEVAESNTRPTEVQVPSDESDKQHASSDGLLPADPSLGQIGASLGGKGKGKIDATPHASPSSGISQAEDPFEGRPSGPLPSSTQIPSSRGSTPSLRLEKDGETISLSSLNDNSIQRRKHSESYTNISRHCPTSSIIFNDDAGAIPLTSSENSILPHSVMGSFKSHRRTQSGSDASHRHPASSFKLNLGDSDEHIPLNSFDHDDPEYQNDPLNDTDSPSEFRITTGWSLKLALLLCHGVVTTCWGIALIFLSLGIVPSDWSFSEGTEINNNGKPPSNILLGLVAAISTIYLTFVVQLIIRQYAHCLMVDGFTLGKLRYLQGIQEISIFTIFPPREKGWRFIRFLTPKFLAWVVVYTGIVLHTSSLIAIFQPKLSISTRMYNDQVPCGIELSNLTLDTLPFLGNPVKQHLMDTASYGIGIQLANYGDQANENITLSISASLYAKDRFAYAVTVGSRLKEGLQEIPGISFSAQCTDEAGAITDIWKAVFPDRSPPTVNILKNGSMLFVDTSLPPSIRSVVTDDGPFNVTKTHTALYALVDPTGSGALYTTALTTSMGAVDLGSTLACSWKTAPKVIYAQIVDFTAGVLKATDTDVYPALAGRATLMTLQGMADASRLGASLIESTYNPLSFTNYVDPLQPDEILEDLLADGGKAGYSYFNRLGSPTMCNSNSRSVIEHWKFGNSGNLGWIATVWTTATGVLALVVAILLSRRKRMENVEVLVAAEAFALGRGNGLSDNEMLCVRDGRVVCAKDPL